MPGEMRTRIQSDVAYGSDPGLKSNWNKPRTGYAEKRRGSEPWTVNQQRTATIASRKLRAGRLVKPSETTYGVFGRLLLEQVHGLEFTLRYKDKVSVGAWGIRTDEELDEKLDFFRERLIACTELAEKGKVHKQDNPLFHRMRNAFITDGMAGLTSEMKYSFINEVVTFNFTKHHEINQEKLADLRYPLEWYPATRALQRTIHLHIGPTNSGKTYHALKRLEAAESGIFAGPLRLLAHEVYTRLNAKGKKCALVTGEERRIPEGYDNTMSSCTVEMVPLNCKVDVAVIDEIQMMGDTERGWAWTQAFLGVQAKEVHLCGEVRTKKIVTELCAAMGDKLVIHEYERLSPLKTQINSLGKLENLEKGDAIILFSRVAIHAMRSDIERITGKRCAVVYGSLPPETRAQQAALFNDPDNDYDYLVASDAVGMGLNLSIKRVIFESTSKHDGVSFRTIKPYEIKQIAGRAGRFKTAQQAIGKGTSNDTEPVDLDTVKTPTTNMGYVTALTKYDLSIVREAMETEVEPLSSVGIFPPADILFRFASYFPPNTPFGYIVLRLHNIASLHPQFHLCRLTEQIQIADLVQEFDLSVMDRITLMSSPASVRDNGMVDVVKSLAQCIAEKRKGALLELQCFDLELIDKDIHDDVDGTKGYLRKAEALHRAITLYLWLSYRFAGIFTNQALAFHVKSLIEEKIDQCLGEVSWTEAQRKTRNFLRMKAIKAAAKEDALLRAAAQDLEEDESSLPSGSGSAVVSSRGEQETEMAIGREDLEKSYDITEIGLDGAGSNPGREDDNQTNAAHTEVLNEERHDFEDSPASDGMIPTTPEELEEELEELGERLQITKESS
ncbi:RNA helicase [Cadophora gregata f. sp. sojae]|nr:RNA helicase [Cadophora gregata f. sp. sojae]